MRKTSTEMTDREIDEHADRMTAYAEVYAEALRRLPPDLRGLFYTHANARACAEWAVFGPTLAAE